MCRSGPEVPQEWLQEQVRPEGAWTVATVAQLPLLLADTWHPKLDFDLSQGPE